MPDSDKISVPWKTVLDPLRPVMCMYILSWASRLSTSIEYLTSPPLSICKSDILILLIIGSFTGGYLGAHLSKLKGNILIKKTFTVICLLVGVSLFFKSIMIFL